MRNLVLFPVVALLVLLAGCNRAPEQENTMTAFAQCLTREGAVMYGTFTCPVCRDQKDMFGAAAEHLLYVECASPGGREMQQACQEQRIQRVPTWIFRGGQRHEGILSLEQLSQRTGCRLP